LSFNLGPYEKYKMATILKKQNGRHKNEKQDGCHIKKSKMAAILNFFEKCKILQVGLGRSTPPPKLSIYCEFPPKKLLTIVRV